MFQHLFPWVGGNLFGGYPVSVHKTQHLLCDYYWRCNCNESYHPSSSCLFQNPLKTHPPPLCPQPATPLRGHLRRSCLPLAEATRRLCRYVHGGGGGGSEWVLLLPAKKGLFSLQFPYLLDEEGRVFDCLLQIRERERGRG